MFNEILDSFGLDLKSAQVTPYGSGLINHTWKVITCDAEYILQKINTYVFKNPHAIDDNLYQLKQYIAKKEPEYLFVSPLTNLAGNTLLQVNGEYFRLFSFVKNSHSVDVVENPSQAYEVAKQFGRFTKICNGFDVDLLQYSLTDFHNLELRLSQFKEALRTGNQDRIAEVTPEIEVLMSFSVIADIYSALIKEGKLIKRVIHHDTKISNVLLDENEKGLCVIDLDTVMPGYFISDVGDMMRTYLSAANEEEKDLTKVNVRTDIFAAIFSGYMEEMGALLGEEEKELFIYSGKFMIYMQALRFFTDYLNNDVYYHTTYPKQNLVRAKNQIKLLEEYVAAEETFKGIMRDPAPCV
ncbi:phosphotransferase enzyme family protein [Pedobacter sp. MW01-1-1]|uniref:phosphotransferase enzyme family protein n=1 Tax=Pedobacter sp. MW01-1-1 TaxID=3383027 RepID=UPI003FEE0F30